MWLDRWAEAGLDYLVGQMRSGVFSKSSRVPETGFPAGRGGGAGGDLGLLRPWRGLERGHRRHREVLVQLSYSAEFIQ